MAASVGGETQTQELTPIGFMRWLSDSVTKGGQWRTLRNAHECCQALLKGEWARAGMRPGTVRRANATRAADDIGRRLPRLPMLMARRVSANARRGWGQNRR